ncbi:MAG: DUF4124 domain-containing protein [Aquabacterium sp.]
MRHRLSAIVLAGCAGIGLAVPAEAAQVFKCRQADGHIAYSQHACDEDTGTTRLRVQDPRTPEQAKQARTMHERDEALARSLNRDRHRANQRAGQQRAMDLTGWPPSGAASASAAGKQAKASSGQSDRSSRRRKKDHRADPHAPKPLRPADFTAQVPGTKGQRTRKPASAKASPSAGN